MQFLRSPENSALKTFSGEPRSSDNKPSDSERALTMDHTIRTDYSEERSINRLHFAMGFLVLTAVTCLIAVAVRLLLLR